MRLGVVMTGNGAHAGAAAGVLQALSARGIEPYAVCGLQGGALAAALYLSGREPDEMLAFAAAAARMGKRLLPQRPRALRARQAFFRGERLERLLDAHTGQRLLPVCPRAGMILCRFVRTGRHVVFSTRAYPMEGGAMLNMQASAAFAARAAAAMPPFLSPMIWLGSPLLPETDVGFACRQLILLGAQRVLIIRPFLSPQTSPDALDLAGMALPPVQTAEPCAAVLHVPMPEGVGALSVDKAPACIQAGREMAEKELDRLFEQMGMGFCRILPFRNLRI